MHLPLSARAGEAIEESSLVSLVQFQEVIHPIAHVVETRRPVEPIYEAIKLRVC